MSAPRRADPRAPKPVRYGEAAGQEPEREETNRPFRLERLGLVMEADPTIPEEAWGVLNPGAVRGPDGALYLFPRAVGARNTSRIARVRVIEDAAGAEAGVERLGYALEPSAPYELRPEEETGGCEDARVVYLEPLRRYVMAYTAWGPHGPRVAFAISDDAATWQRLGLADFGLGATEYGVDFNAVDNKDAVPFPRPVTSPDGREALAILHRPVFGPDRVPHGIADPRPSIWISYCDLDAARRDARALTGLRQHHLLAAPAFAWEALKIGAGAPPIETPHGWLLLYHGVHGSAVHDELPRALQPVVYCAGALVLDRGDPRRVLYRSQEPILCPETADELEGMVPHVVFPTGTDDRGDGTIDVYYGMADLRIGAARLRLPKEIPLATP